MEDAGLFTTTGDAIAPLGLRIDNSQTYVSVLTDSESELFIQINGEHLILGTYLYVQRNRSRPHAVIYLEKKYVSVYDIHDGETSIRHELHAYFTRCLTMLKEQRYTILPQNKYLLTLTEMSDIPKTQELPDDVYQYVAGRLLMVTKLCCHSENPVLTMGCISHLLAGLPPEILPGLTLTISKNRYDGADISFAENTDRLYQLDLNKREIQNTEHPEQYKRFGVLYAQLTDADRKSAMKNYLLSLAEKSPVDNADNQVFLRQENLTTAGLSSPSSSVIAKSCKEDADFVRKPNLIRKTQHRFTTENLFSVEYNGKKLLEGIDYLYDSVKRTVILQRPLISHMDNSFKDALFEEETIPVPPGDVMANLRDFPTLIPNRDTATSSELTAETPKGTGKIQILEMPGEGIRSKRFESPIQQYCTSLRQREEQLKKLIWFFDYLPPTRESRKFAFSFQTEILRHIQNLMDMGFVPETDWEAAIKTPATLYGIREAAADVISSMDAVDSAGFTELKKALTHHFEILAYYGERIDAVSDYRLKNSLSNLILSEDIAEEQLQQLERDMNTYLNASPKKNRM